MFDRKLSKIQLLLSSSSLTIILIVIKLLPSFSFEKGTKKKKFLSRNVAHGTGEESIKDLFLFMGQSLSFDHGPWLK